VSKADLRVDWASHEAAKYAVENWHYSKCLPVGKLVKVGVWESGEFIGVVLFGRGANNNMSKAFLLKQTECCELVRVALTSHICKVTRIISIALRFIKANCSGIRLVISYADPNHGHIGGIYQGGNWIYSGVTIGTHMLRMPNGELLHKRTAMSKFGTCDSKKLSAKYEYPENKHRYLMPLDNEMRQRIAQLAKPYPKRPKQATDSDQESSGSATLTRTLQID